MEAFQYSKVGKLNKEAYFLQFRGWEVQEHGDRAYNGRAKERGSTFITNPLLC